MGKSSPSPPATPDPSKTASAQASANVGTATANAYLNNPNYTTPYGTSTTTQTGQSMTITNPDGTTSTVPQFAVTQTLSPAQQALFDQQNQLKGTLNSTAQSALNSVQGTLASPITQSQLSPLRMGVGTGPSLDLSYDKGQVQTGYDAGGSIVRGYDTGPALQTGYASGGAIQRLGGPTLQGTDAPSVFGNTSASIQNDVDLNTNTPTAFGATARGVQYGLGNTDFTADRDSTTNSILQRLQPSMAAQQESLDARLANQGTAQGSSAYNAAQLQQNQANNDLRLGAVQAGDAEQQALFGERLNTGQFNNAAQDQDYQQQLGRGQFAQAGIAANNQATLAAGQFHNQAQQQDFGQLLDRANYAQNAYGMNNAAIGANNQATLGFGAFNNAAQAQAEGQNAARAGFFNQAVGQQNQQNAALAAFQNAAQGQANSQNAAAAAFNNTAQGQQNDMNAQLTAFSNQAQNQAFQNWINGSQFANQAAGQQLQQRMALQNQQINQISALMNGGQIGQLSLPGYTGAQIDQTPYSSDVYASAGLQNDQYKAQLQESAANNAAFGSAIGGLAGGIGRKSDRRLKTHARRVARARNGLAIWAYRMPGEVPGWHLGFMADEVALLHPEAVWTDPVDGFARVDYGRAVA